MTSLFKDLDKTFNDNSMHSNLLGHCVEIIVERLGVSINKTDHHNIEILSDMTIANFHNYAKEFNIVAHRVQQVSLTEMKQSFYPILFELDCEYGLRVLISYRYGKYHVYNPYTQNYEVIDNIMSVNIAWQCFPVNVSLSGKYHKLLLYIFTHFQSEIIKSIVFGIFISVTTLLVSITSGYVLANIHDIAQHSYLTIISPAILFILSSFFITYMNDVNSKNLSIKLLFHIMPTIWYRILNLPLKLLKEYASGDIVQRLFDFEITLLSCVTTSWSILFNTFAIFLLFGYMVYCNLFLSILYLALCLTVLMIKILLFRKNIDYLISKMSLSGQLVSLMSEILLQIHKVRTAGFECGVFALWFQKQIQIKKLEEKSVKIEIMSTLLESFLPVILFILLCFILKRIPDKNIRFITILPFMYCSAQFHFAFEKLAADTIILIHLLPGLARIKPIIDLRIENSANKKRNRYFEGKLELRNVKLINTESNQLILNNISLCVDAGSFVALIGASGAGKSSIFRLILGFETANAGSILIDGHHINDLDLQFMRKQFGVVLQTSNVLPGTIYSNIAANANITINEAWKLAEYVNLDEEIQKMPMKMHTHISDNAGESISGGQKQKILIARALAAKPQILLLDEATSALDNKSQAVIYNNLKFFKITRLVIAHRYSTIVDADKIYVIDKGEVVNSGTYQELFANNRSYSHK